MKKKRGILGVFIVLAILVLGIGYAFQAGNLTIDGTLGASASSDNFIVEFGDEDVVITKSTDLVTTADGTKATQSSDSAVATFTATDFTKRGDYVEFTYQVSNKSLSDDLAAAVTATVASTYNTTYFDVNVKFDESQTANATASTTINPSKTANLIVRVECIKTPDTDVQASKVEGMVTISSYSTAPVNN